MKKTSFIIGAAALLSIVGPGVGSALASGNTQTQATVGNCISDGMYGNEPNMANGALGGPAEQAPGTQAGNVLPTQSPGPQKTLPDGTVVRGSSVGDIQQAGFSVPEICRGIVGK